MKEVIKKLLKSAPIRKGGEKNGSHANDMINTTNVNLNFGLASWESFLRHNITSSWIHFQLRSSAKMFQVLFFEAILFTFSCINLGEKTRIFFFVEPFSCMPYMKCLSKCPYSKAPIPPCAPITLILTFVPVSGFLQIYSFTYRKLIHDTI